MTTQNLDQIRAQITFLVDTFTANRRMVKSGNDEVLKRMHQNITVEQVRKAFRLAREACMFIVGYLALKREKAEKRLNRNWRTC